MPKKNEETLHNVLTSIDISLKKQNSKQNIFIQGVIRGLGTALGATVILALVTSFAWQLLGSLDSEVFSRYFMNEVVDE